MQKRLLNNKLLSIIAVIILSFVLAVGLASCSSNKDKKGRDQKKTEVAKEKTSSQESTDSSSANNESAGEPNDNSDAEKRAREKELERKKAKEKEREKANAEKAKKSSSDSGSSGPAHSKKKWVPAVYKTVTHPAVTRQQKYVDYYTCQCGATFDTNAKWQAHRPKP